MTITIYFDFSHHVIYFLCMLRSNKFNVVNSMFFGHFNVYGMHVFTIIYYFDCGHVKHVN